MGPTIGYFTTDRAIKYGWGIPRLAVLCVLAFELAPRISSAVPAAESLGLAAYLRSGRWIAHAYIGSIGAAVNVQVRGLAFNVLMLLVAACLILLDLRRDYAILIYMCKTFSGDFIAGKLDTLEWRLVLLFTCAVGIAACYFEAANAPAAYMPYQRILPTLAAIQLICEMGDNHLEKWTFFRHRYSFELLNAAVLFGLTLSPAEFLPIQHDLVICWFYRVSNGAIILAKSGDLMLLFRRVAFRFFGLLRGLRLQVVSDVDIALAVLRSSCIKGDALERLVASPAWAPVLSLESVDGALHQEMISDFHKLVASLPPPSVLIDIAKLQVDQLKHKASISGKPIDAEDIAYLTVLCFTRYLFSGKEGRARGFSVEKEHVLVRKIVAGSWEWRKEIAVRGTADQQIKLEAVEALLTLLQDSTLWPLFSDDWRTPQY